MAPTRFNILPKNDTLMKNIRQLSDCVRQSPIKTRRIIASDCGLTFFPYDPVRDTCFMAPYVVDTYNQMLPYFYGAGYHTLSDQNEDHMAADSPFHGGPGLLTIHGLKKASYNAYALLKLLGPQILKRGKNYIFSRSDKGYQLLLYNMANLESIYTQSDVIANAPDRLCSKVQNSPDVRVHLFLELKPGTYTVKKHLVNPSNGSAYDIWLHMGAPQLLNPDTIAYINSRATPEITLTTMDIRSHLTLDVALPLHNVVLLEIEPIRR